MFIQMRDLAPYPFPFLSLYFLCPEKPLMQDITAYLSIGMPYSFPYCQPHPSKGAFERFITLSKVVEQLLTMGSPTSGLLWECFSSLLAAFARWKEIQEENSKDEEIEETENEDEESDDDDEDSDDDVHDETEEEFLERYAEAAAALENGALAEEGDLEDFDEEPELGSLEELDPQIILQSLLERYQQTLLETQSLSPQLISSLLSFFPEYTRFFQ